MVSSTGTIKTPPILIVGGGLSGLWLAINLIERGEHVVLFDTPKPNAASRIGAGVINPITGKRAAKTWEVDTFLQYLIQRFESPYLNSLKCLLQPLQLYRPFKTAFEANEWAGKSADPNFAPFVHYQFGSKGVPELIDPFGGINIQGYRLQVNSFIEKVIPILSQTGRFQFLNKPLLKSQLFLDSGEFELDGKRESYRFVVNCTGTDILQDPDWPAKCVVPLKGQLGFCTFEPPTNVDFGLSRAVFVLNEGSYFLIGSTYELDFEDESVTNVSTQQLQDKAQELLAIRNIHWLNQQAGLRPTTFDRKPLIGKHFRYDNYFMLNGLGTKGVLIAPLTANILADNMLKNIPIPKELNWNRLLDKKRASILPES